MSSLFSDLMRNIDESILASFGAAARGMSDYVLPIAWIMFAITVLMWSIMVMEGKVQSPMNDWLSKGLVMLLTLTAAGTFYAEWVSGPLFMLPNELARAVTGDASATSALDALSADLDQLIMGIAQGMVAAFKNFNFGAALLLLVSMVAVALAGSLLEVACVFNMIYAKLGLAMMLGVGPFFVICLMWPQTKGYFTSWLNTVLYFVFLTVLTTMVMVIFIKIASKFMDKLIAAVKMSSGLTDNMAFNLGSLLVAQITGDKAETAMQNIQGQFNILSVSIQMVLVFLPMFFVAIEMRTMVSSLTGGSGGSFGTTATQLLKTIRTGGRI